MKKFVMLILVSTVLTSCGGFKAKRVSTNEGDSLGMEITDKWLTTDTELVTKEILEQISKHKGFQRYLAMNGKAPKVFIAEVQNETSEAYFPIADLNDELLQEFSMSGDFILIDAASREKILKEIKYQNDGMVDPAQIKKIGKQAGADLLIFGSVRMQPHTRDGKTLKEYSVNIRMTNLETSVEVLRARSKTSKYSTQSGSGW